jgi:hypothetical protein
MNLCLSGHENPTGAVYCVVCGVDLTLTTLTTGKQCIHGHPMTLDEETCAHCGNLPMVVNDAADVGNYGGTGSALISKLDLGDMQQDAMSALRTFRKNFRKKIKLISLIAFISIAIPFAYFGYTAYTGPNYAGTTIEEVFKNREDQIAQVVQPACTVGKSEITSAENDIEYTSEAILDDYHVALGFGVSAPSTDDVRSKIRGELEKQLKAVLGEKYIKLEKPGSVVSSSIDSALEFCKLEEPLNDLKGRAAKLAKAINAIQSPGSWASSGYYYDDEDPNMAYKWAPKSSFPNGGWAVDIISRLGCTGVGKVTLDGIYGDYYGYSGNMRANKKYRVKVYSGLVYLSESASVDEVTCRQ